MTNIPAVASGPAGPTRDIAAIAAELGSRHAQLAAFRGPHPDEHRVLGELCDLLDELGSHRPRNVREALTVAAVAAGLAVDIDEEGAPTHQRVTAMLAQLVDYLEAAAGVTAAALGVGSYADGRHDGPRFSACDRNEDFGAVMNIMFERGRAAARRASPV